MSICENCGNEYAKAFQVMIAGRKHTFDSFECAINVLAPKCNHCLTRVIGHGVESRGKIYCCAHCAQHEGVEGLRDHV